MEVLQHLNQQGADKGEEYRSIILYTSDAQKETAEKVKKGFEDAKIFKDPIVTEIKKLDAFYEAEEEHKQFYEKNRYNFYCMLVINPKLQALKNKHKALLKDTEL